MMMGEIKDRAILCISDASAKVSKNGELTNIETEQELQALLESLIQKISSI